MKLVDESVLDLFRGPGRCEWCKKNVRDRDPHHVFSRGAGRVDHPWSLVALCKTFCGGDNCHAAFHNGTILREDLLPIIAKREGVLQSDIEELVYLIRRLPKGQDHARIRDFEAHALHKRREQGQGGHDGVRPEVPRTQPGDRLPGLEAYEGWTTF